MQIAKTIMTDQEAYNLCTKDNIWYNKLFVASILNYNAGYKEIPASGKYIIKPIINLLGCGIGASIGYYEEGDIVPDGYFYSEVFTGRHITIDYTKINGKWKQGSTFEGFKSDINNLQQFSMWERVDYCYELPDVFNNIITDKLNIELIGDKIIEVHLRHNTDPIS